ATGRSDYPNQINNVLAFPGIFRGALDVRASEINEEMKLAAAEAIASAVRPDELSAEQDLLQRHAEARSAEARRRLARPGVVHEVGQTLRLTVEDRGLLRARDVAGRDALVEVRLERGEQRLDETVGGLALRRRLLRERLPGLQVG